jgi:type I restriction enzyme, S subunit
MNNVSMKLLGDVIELKYGKPISPSDRDSNGENCVYGANGVLGRTNRFLIDDEALIVGRKGSAGQVNRVSGKFWPSDVTYYVLGNEHINIDYLYFLLEYLNLPKLSKGVKPGLNRNDVYSIVAPIPSIKEQVEISNVLRKADSLNQKRKQATDLLNEYLKSVFLEMFGNPMDNSKKWSLKKFGTIGKLDRGISKHRPRNAPELLGGDHPLIQTGDVSSPGIYIQTYKSTYSDIGLKQSKKWPKGTLCITIAANIAKTGILNFDACFPDSVVGFIPDQNQTNNLFIHFWISFLQEMLERNAPVSAQKNINLRILRELDVFMPPIESQNKFADIVIHTELIKQKMLAQSKELDNQFQALMQKSFNAN